MAAVESERFFQPGLTGLRALAALWVMAFHLNAIAGPREVSLFGLDLHPLMTVGWVGVNVFFVLSGFLLTTHLMQVASARGLEPALPRYFAARIRRVFPAYWAQIAVLLLLHVATTGALPGWHVYLPLHAFMLHNLSEAASFAINPVYWTLPIEFGFYLALPMLARWLLRIEATGRGKWWKLAATYAIALGVAVGWRVAMFAAYPAAEPNTLIWAMSQLPGTIDEFVLGSAIAVALRWARADGLLPSRERLARASNALALAGLAGIVAMMYALDAVYEQYWSGHALLFAWYSIVCVFIGTLVAGIALAGPVTRALFENRAAIFLGTVSYSIYLWHFPVGQAVKGALFGPGPAPLATYGLVATAAVIAVSAVSYYVVERPFLRPSAAPAAAPLAAMPPPRP